MSNILEKPDLADHAKTKAQLLAELNDLRQRVAQVEAEALTQTEGRYRSVVTAMAEGVVMLHRSGEIVACNPAAEQILGLTQEQMMGRTTLDPCWRAIHPDGTLFPGETHPVTITLQTGQPQRHITMGVHKPDGSLTWILINSEPMVQPGASEPYAVVATFTNITHQRQTEELLRQSEAKYQAIFDNDIYAICLFDQETRQLLDVNEAFTRLYGYSRAELLAGMTNYDLTAETEATEADLRQGNLPGPLFVPLRYHRKKDGTIFPVEIGGGVYQWQGRTVIFALVHDISVRKQAEKALLESQERLALTIKGADLATWDWHVPSKFVVFNERWAEMLGYTVAEIEPHVHSWEKLLHRDDAPAVMAAVNAHLEGRTSLYQTEHRLHSKSGEWKWVLDTGRVLERDEQGQAVRVVGIHQDITERKQAEAAQRASEARFATIFQASPLSISIIRLKDHQLIDVNPTWLTKTGFSREEVIGRTPLELNLWVNPDERDQFLTQLSEQGAVQGLEVQFRLKSGVVVDVLILAELIDIAGERCMLVITQDITARKQAEVALRASEARFATVFRVSPLSISIIRVKDSQIIDVNEMWLTKTGYSREEVIGRTPLELNLWPDPADRERMIRQLHEDGTLQGFEAQIRVKSGGVDDVLMSAGLVEVAGELCLLTLGQGISERKRMEEALRASEDKFRQIIQHSNNAIILYNETGQLVEWNPAAEQLTGLVRAAVLGQPILDIRSDLLPREQRTPADYEQAKARMQAYLHPTSPQRLVRPSEHAIQRADGSYRDVHATQFSFKTEQGFFAGSIVRDVTEHKQTERIEAAQLAVSQVLAGSPETVVALRQVLESVAASLEWEVAKLWWPDSNGSHLVWQDGWHVSNRFDLAEFNRVSRDYTFERGEGLVGRVWEMSQAIWNQNLQEVKGASPALTAGLHSAIGIPIIKDEVTVGVMTYFSHSARPLDERLLSTLTDLGRQIGQFLARQEAEAALHESQERLELVVAAAELGTWDSHLPSGIAVFNERWAEMLGYTLVELEPTLSAWEKLADPDDLAKVQESFQAHLEGQIPHFQIEHRLRTKSGEWKWILTTGKVMVRDEQGQPIRVVGIHQDITARKQAEESLRRYQQMVSTTPDWMALVDRNYIYQIVNQPYLTLTNKSIDQIIGHSVAELLGEPVFMEAVKPYWDRALAGETVKYQAWFDFPGVGQRFIDVIYAPHQEKDGTISGVVVIGRDVTEAKLLEERLHQAQKMETVGQLAAGMAHHYNSMLTTIIGFSSLSLHRLPPSDLMVRNLKQILQTAERMAVLVRQLLAFSRRQLLQPKTVNLNELILRLQPELEQHLSAAVEFILRLAPEVGQVKIDPGQFEHLLRALVSNAVDAMPEGGRLTLTTANVSLGPVEAGWYELPPGDYVLLTVQDTGIGLTEEVKAHLFEPFFTTKDVGQGTGLGLAMSLGIAKQHGGHLLAESEMGQGATFMLYLPRLAPPSPIRPASTQTILLVEAEPMVREFVAELLTDQGYTVLKATTNEVALQLMVGQPEVSLHLLLTPTHSNSPALIEQFKTNSPDLKVIFLIDELEELPQERVDFLLKPFTPSSLVQMVRAVLEAASE